MANDQAANVRRLRGLMAIFGLSIQDVADAGRVSRPLVSGLLSGRPGVRANGLFPELERNLCSLVAKRGHPFFDLQGVPVDEVEQAARSRASWSKVRKTHF